MVTANGGYLTKHAAGIYSTMPVSGPWQRESPATYQRQIDRLPRPPLLEAPTGQGVIETYTVTYGRDGVPNRGIIIGRMGDINDPSTPRFLANAPADAATLTAMTETDFIGIKRGSKPPGRHQPVYTRLNGRAVLIKTNLAPKLRVNLGGVLCRRQRQHVLATAIWMSLL